MPGFSVGGAVVGVSLMSGFSSGVGDAVVGVRLGTLVKESSDLQSGMAAVRLSLTR